MSGLNILKDLKLYFHTKRVHVNKSIVHTEEGCKNALDQYAEISRVEKRVISILEEDDDDELDIEQIAQDLDILEDGEFKAFWETKYGKSLFYGVIDQIATQTGQDVDDNNAKTYTLNLFHIHPDNIHVSKVSKNSNAKCYLCNMVHTCSHKISVFDDEYRIDSKCAMVVHKIINFTTLLLSDYTDIKKHVKYIDRVHTKLLNNNKKIKR